jgi:hypothetical protein
MKIEERDKILNDLYAEYPLENEIEFNEFNIQEKIRSYGKLFIKYKDILIREKSALEHLLDLKSRLEGKLYDDYKFNNEKILTKQEIEKYYIPKHENIVKIKNLIDRQTIRLEFFDMAVKVIEKLSWNMKNFMEADK